MRLGKLILLAGPCGAALSACVVAPVPGPYYAAPAGEVVIADAPPPRPYVEAIPPPPYVGAIWIGGYWGWRARRHIWIAGHYEAPRPGYVWEPHRWVAHDGRWRLEGGAWIRR